MHEDSTTPSPRKRRRQAYSKLIRLFLQNTKDRLDTIRDVIRDESELHFRLTRPPGEEPAPPSTHPKPTEQSEKIRFSDDENRQFIDFAFADTTNADEMLENIDKIENAPRDSAAQQTYLNSLFAAVGYRRITTTTANPIASDDETTSSSIIGRYLINPLVSAWNSTRERFNWNSAGHGDNDDRDDNGNDDNNDDDDDNAKRISSSSTSIGNSDASDGQTMLFRVNFFNNRRDNITPNMHTNSKSDAPNKEPNENRVDNFNYSLPLNRLTPNNVTDDMPTNETMAALQVNANNANVSQTMVDVDYIGNDHSGSDKKPRNTVNPDTASRMAHRGVEDAVEAFRNAFLKYSNYMQQQNSTEYAKFDTSTSENAKFTRRQGSHAMNNGKLLDGSGGGGDGDAAAAFFAGNLFETNSSHIQVVPSKKLKTNASISENVTIANDVDGIAIELPAKSFAENAGILILEIFGTVIGMTWRAINGIPNYLNAHHNNNQNADA